MFSLCSFRQPEYVPGYSQNFGRTKYFAVYAAKTYSIILELLGMLQPPFLKPFSKFLTYKNNRNTYNCIQRY